MTLHTTIGLAGHAGVGKDSAAAHLASAYGYARVAFADPIRAAALRANPRLPSGRTLADAVRCDGWEATKRNGGRAVLQDLGDAARASDPLVWVRLARATKRG